MHTVVLLIAAGALGAYPLFLLLRLGIHQRLPLVLTPISIDTIADRAARSHGDRPLFTTDAPVAWRVPQLHSRFPDTRLWSAQRIRETADYLATALRRSVGMAEGDRVAILKRNHLDIHVLATGVIRAGGVACPINDGFPGSGFDAYLTRLGARVLVSDAPTLLRLLAEGARLDGVEHIVTAGAALPELQTAVENVSPGTTVRGIEELLGAVGTLLAPMPRPADSSLYIVHSSGTTGVPKPVVLRNGAQSHAVRGWLSYVHLSRTVDRGYLAVPNNHQAVLLTFNSLLLLGLCVHWTEAYSRAGFDAVRVLRELAEGGFTGFFGFPITYTQMKEALPGERLERMRFWASTADAMHENVVRRFTRVGGAFRSVGLPVGGSIFLDAQGSSEVGTPSVLRYFTRFTRRFERRVGRPGSNPFGPQVRIIRPDGQPAQGGQVGRLEVSGRTVFSGYWGDPALTAEVIRDGWFFTGDVARWSEDGHVVQLDREVDVIRTRRGPVHSLPIEERVHEHPAVFDACVYGRPRPEGLQEVAAAIALRDGYELEPEELLRALNRRLAPAERIGHLEIRPWSSFPIGLTGKTLKRAFRDGQASARGARHAEEARRSAETFARQEA